MLPADAVAKTFPPAINEKMPPCVLLPVAVLVAAQSKSNVYAVPADRLSIWVISIPAGTPDVKTTCPTLNWPEKFVPKDPGPSMSNWTTFVGFDWPLVVGVIVQPLKLPASKLPLTN